jgi:chromatin segregation and condensation protein Rec8/ScpA/Scc1 (kleisin family)
MAAWLAYLKSRLLLPEPAGEGEPSGAELAAALAEADPCLMCAETDWRRCHRRLISDLLTAREIEVVHLVRPGERQPHELWPEAEIRDGRLYLCAEVVA